MEDVWKDISEMNSDLIGCEKCPRLVTFRKEVAKRDKKFRGQEYWSRPVPGYGDISGRLLIVGLAPAATGGNRTGRVFTGDKSSDFLVSCLFEAGITNQPTSVSRAMASFTLIRTLPQRLNAYLQTISLPWMK